MNPRRLVTGHDPGGKSTVVRDDIVAPVTLGLLPGFEWHALSGSDDTVNLPNDGSEAPARAYFPPVGGYRFMCFTIPPDGVSPVNEDLDLDAAIAEFEEKLPGMAAHMEPENPGMHTTATVDCGVVVAGEITLELDDGATHTLRTGDTYVQNGTRHRWSNAGDIPAVIAVVAIGAEHAGVSDVNG